MEKGIKGLASVDTFRAWRIMAGSQFQKFGALGFPLAGRGKGRVRLVFHVQLVQQDDWRQQ